MDIVNNFYVEGINPVNSNVFDFNSCVDVDNLFSFRRATKQEDWDSLNIIKSKSADVDGVSLQFLKIMYPHISKIWIYNLVNSILMTSMFSDTWKVVRVVPIPKSGVVHGLDNL